MAPQVAEIGRALDEALSLGETERREMGVRGRQLIAREHSLEQAARTMEQAYAWIATGEDRPDSIC